MNKNESKYFNTALLMNEALLNILEKKDFEFITVKEICQKAGVSRSAFYLHYETMDDLLRETIENVNKEFDASFNDINKDNLAKKVLTRKEYLIPYLSYIKAHMKIYRLMHDKSYLFGTNVIAKELYNGLFDKALTRHNVLESEKKYILSFYIAGVLSIVNTWLKGNCIDSIEFVVSLIERMTYENELINYNLERKGTRLLFFRIRLYFDWHFKHHKYNRFILFLILRLCISVFLICFI